MQNLQIEINNLEQNSDKKKSLEFYNTLLEQCVKFKEMRATVYIYDDMIKNKIKPSDTTFEIIDKLHSKTIPECSNIYIKEFNNNSLQPRRRIHKIIKGYNYSKNYNNSMVYLEDVKKYLDVNPNIKVIKNRHKLAKVISKSCNISITDSRYIITKLKRIKYLTEEASLTQTKDIRDFFKSK